MDTIEILWYTTGVPDAFSMGQLNKSILSYIAISIEGFSYRLITDSVDLNETALHILLSSGLALFSVYEFVKFVYVL